MIQSKKNEPALGGSHPTYPRYSLRADKKQYCSNLATFEPFVLKEPSIESSEKVY